MSTIAAVEGTSTPRAFTITKLNFGMLINRDGTATVVPDPSPWKVVRGDDVPPLLKAAAEEVVFAEAAVEWIEHNVQDVDLTDQTNPFLIDDLGTAKERMWMVQQAFRNALSDYYRWACVIVLDHAVWLDDPKLGRPEVTCASIDGQEICRMCFGAGRRRTPLGPNAIGECEFCHGRGVQQFQPLAWVADGLAATDAARKAEEAAAIEF